MAIIFPDNLYVGAGNPLDAKYLSTLNTPYTGVTAVNTRIPVSQRYVGLTVNISNIEYWYRTGVTNTDLVVKTTTGSTGGGGGTTTGATSGLHVQGKDIALGGSLTGDTIIGDALYEYHLKYGNNYALNYTNRSLVDKEYVDSMMFGTQYHIPIFSLSGNQIEDSSLEFINDTLYNPNDLSIEVEDGKNLYLLGMCSGLNENKITLGKPTLNSGFTSNLICVAGQAVNMDLTLASKGSGCILLNSPSIYLSNNGLSGLYFNSTSATLRLPQLGKIIGYTGTGDASPICFAGGCGASIGLYCGSGGHVCICGGNAGDGTSVTPKVGGDIILKAGAGVSGGAQGRIKLCNLPLQSTETAVIYLDTNGNLSCGLAGGGTSLYNSDSPSTCEVGGLPVGYGLSGKTLVCILKDMLVPEKFGALGDPYTSISPASMICEIGKQVSFGVTGTFNQGYINPQGMSASPYRVGGANHYCFTGAQVVGYYLCAASSMTCNVSSYPVVAGTQTWQVNTYYNTGTQPLGSKGTPFATACPASNTNFASMDIKGILPWYWGKSSSMTLTPTCVVNYGSGGSEINNKMVSDVTATPIQITYNSTAYDYLWFALPQCAAPKTWWKVSDINKGQIGIYLFNSYCTLTLSSAEGCWGSPPEPYKVYVSMYPTGTDAGIPMCIY